MENDDVQKLKLIGKLTNVKVPTNIPCNLVDLKNELQREDDSDDLQDDKLLNQVGYPKRARQVA